MNGDRVWFYLVFVLLVWKQLITDEKNNSDRITFSETDCSLQTRAFSLCSFVQLLNIICLILTSPWLFCLSWLIFSSVYHQIQLSTTILKQPHSTQIKEVHPNAENSGKHFLCTISSSLIVISLRSENQPVSQHGGKLLVMCPASLMWN